MQTSEPLGGQFFSDTPDSVFTPEDFDRDELLMVETADQFARKEVLPIADRLDQQEDGLMPNLIRKAGEIGLCGIDSPDEFGGLGLGKNIAARILEFMSQNASFSVTYGITSGISQVGLSLFGTTAQKQQYLPRLTSGEWIGAYALSEPNSGSDALSASTRADLRGDKYILNGTKMWISNAKWANLFLVLAKIDGDKFTAFLVERDFPGVSISREEHKMGLKGSSTARLVLEDAEVPAENLLHNSGQGHHVAFNALNIGRFKLSSMSIGPCRDAMFHAANYALDRKQFGQPISTFGLIQKKFAHMAAQFFVAESMIYRTGALIDAAFERHGGTVDGNRRAAEEYAIECSICKVFSTEAESSIMDDALQVFGGYGFTEEFPIARHYRDARISRIYEGTNEINLLFIADRLQKRIREEKISNLGCRDSFIASLTAAAFDLAPTDQVGIGALSELLILSYAEQSARLRAARLGGVYTELYDYFIAGANAQAAAAYQLVTGRSVSLPEPPIVNIENIAQAVYKKKAPL